MIAEISASLTPVTIPVTGGKPPRRPLAPSRVFDPCSLGRTNLSGLVGLQGQAKPFTAADLKSPRLCDVSAGFRPAPRTIGGAA